MKAKRKVALQSLPLEGGGICVANDGRSIRHKRFCLLYMQLHITRSRILPQSPSVTAPSRKGPWVKAPPCRRGTIPYLMWAAIIPFALYKKTPVAQPLKEAEPRVFLNYREICKPGSVRQAATAIYLEYALLHISSHLQSCVGQTQTNVCLHTVLHRIGFTFAHSCLSCRWALTSPFHPYSVDGANGAVYFCCTFPEVSLGGRYPLSCPIVPGLSSHQYLSAQ